ncbi:MAG: flavodoxin family protein [Ruminococcaceae bacterium]|nr:flavodoxin family protein [Oscillospiraceae bacterium]
MSLLIINTLPEDDKDAVEAIKALTENILEFKVVNTCAMKISHCTGCCDCMLKNPGVCSVKDDYEEIFSLFFDYCDIVFLSDTSLDFLSYETVNIIQRMFPLVTVFSVYEKGKILHIPRYEKKFRIGLLYKNNPETSILYPWFDKYIEHFSSTSLGIHPIKDVKEIKKCIL